MISKKRSKETADEADGINEAASSLNPKPF